MRMRTLFPGPCLSVEITLLANEKTLQTLHFIEEKIFLLLVSSGTRNWIDLLLKGQNLVYWWKEDASSWPINHEVWLPASYKDALHTRGLSPECFSYIKE